jgi:hypothetical protein
MFPFAIYIYVFFLILPFNSQTYGFTAVPAGNRPRSSNQPSVTLLKCQGPHTSRDVILLQ